jgi:hypothetical protein
MKTCLVLIDIERLTMPSITSLNNRHRFYPRNNLIETPVIYVHRSIKYGCLVSVRLKIRCPLCGEVFEYESSEPIDTYNMFQSEEAGPKRCSMNCKHCHKCLEIVV